MADTGKINIQFSKSLNHHKTPKYQLRLEQTQLSNHNNNQYSERKRKRFSYNNKLGKNFCHLTGTRIMEVGLQKCSYILRKGLQHNNKINKVK